MTCLRKIAISQPTYLPLFVVLLVFILYELNFGFDCEQDVFKEIINIRLEPSQLENINQEDPLLWKYVRTFHVFPPSIKPYNIEKPYPSHFNSQMIIKRVMQLLHNKTNGIFVDVGAFDGEYYSNTLYLEQKLGWTGLLIEGDPMTFPLLKSKNRKAWISDVCLSPLSHPNLVDFQHVADNVAIASKIGSRSNAAKKWQTFEVQCFPLYSILAAVSVTSIDYFSLDVEGIEMKVLKELPWDKIFVKVFSIEHHLIPEGPEALKDFMTSKGYKLVETIKEDFIFAHVSILDINMAN